MSVLDHLSPMTSTEKFCKECEEETLHVSYLTALSTNPLARYYDLECEICMLSREWN
jgi:hypothetical protein